MTKALTKAQIETFFEKLHAANPSPQGELNYTNNFTLLLAVVLSAQATDKGVNKATGSLFEKISTPEEILALGEDGLKDYIKSIGLFNSKAKNILLLSQILVDKHGSQVPDNRASLEALPGVGRKTANVVLNVAFGHPTMAVDTHIFRISNRTGLAKGKTPEAVEKDLLKRVPKRWLHDGHHWLILLGRYTCVARKPKCDHCVVRDVCNYEMKTS